MKIKYRSEYGYPHSGAGLIRNRVRIPSKAVAVFRCNTHRILKQKSVTERAVWEGVRIIGYVDPISDQSEYLPVFSRGIRRVLFQFRGTPELGNDICNERKAFLLCRISSRANMTCADLYMFFTDLNNTAEAVRFGNFY